MKGEQVGKKGMLQSLLWGKASGRIVVQRFKDKRNEIYV
jgi:hypothetical protein